MTAIDWLVIAAGLGAIVWVNWYFFLADSRPRVRGERRGDGNRS